jgi:hypothetical protein
MKGLKPALLVGTLLGLAGGTASADGGYATRDLNPILQPIYLPTLATFKQTDGWKIDHSFYVTNTMQKESKGDERLLIDVENYRYELGLRYRHDRWLARVDLPFVANSGGELDSSIDSWHKFWGLPEGDRNDYPNDQIDVNYSRDGDLEYKQDRSSSGIGDIALAIGYQLNAQWAWFAGIELPSGDSGDFSGNEEIDSALWVTYQREVDDELGIFALLGVSFPGSGDYLGGYVEDSIWVAQTGFDYRLYPTVIANLQLDMHSQSVEDSELDAFGNSMQVVLGVGFLRLVGEHRLDLFFSEDILVGTAPDISFGLRLSRSY